jgi:membrane protein DedA with SNARE-associated domain
MEDLPGYAESVVRFVEQNRNWGPPLIFILAFGESLAFVSLLLPFWVMLVGIGALIGGSGTMNELIIVWIAASLGAAFGDWVSYWLGQHFHEEIAAMWPLSRHPDLIPRGHDFFERYGAWAIVIGRFFGPLRAAVPLVAGIVEMPWRTFQIANFASAFLWAGVLLMPGAFGLHWLMEWLH